MTPRAFALTLHEQRVAVLVEGGRGTSNPFWTLQFDRAWIERPQRPTVSLAFRDWRLEVNRRFPGRMPPLLTNLLPERGGALRRRIARTFNIDENDDAEFLNIVGADMSGALVCTRLDDANVSGRTVDAPSTITDPAAEVLRHSLGGMQLKFSVDRTDRLTLRVHGRGGRWILKIPDPGRPSLARREYAALEWAREIGFVVPEAEIVDPREVEGLPVDGVPAEALLVRRFDRRDDHSRVHMEELTSVMGLHPEEKFPGDSSRHTHTLTSVAAIVRRFVGSEDAETFITRIAFDALVGNGDAHLKNWAFVYPDGRTPRLAPVYDVFPTVLLGDPGFALPLKGHPFKGIVAFRAIDVPRLRQLAIGLKLSPDAVMDRVGETVRRALQTFEAVLARTTLPPEDRALWREHLDSLPLTKL